MYLYTVVLLWIYTVGLPKVAKYSYGQKEIGQEEIGQKEIEQKEIFLNLNQKLEDQYNPQLQYLFEAEGQHSVVSEGE